MLSGPVCYFRLATESDDSVAKSVGSIFYCFINKNVFLTGYFWSIADQFEMAVALMSS